MNAEAERLKRALHDLSLHGAASRDEAHACGLLSYYITGKTLEKLVDSIKEPKP